MNFHCFKCYKPLIQNFSICSDCKKEILEQKIKNEQEVNLGSLTTFNVIELTSQLNIIFYRDENLIFFEKAIEKSEYKLFQKNVANFLIAQSQKNDSCFRKICSSQILTSHLCQIDSVFKTKVALYIEKLNLQLSESIYYTTRIQQLYVRMTKNQQRTYTLLILFISILLYIMGTSMIMKEINLFFITVFLFVIVPAFLFFRKKIIVFYTKFLINKEMMQKVKSNIVDHYRFQTNLRLTLKKFLSIESDKNR